MPSASISASDPSEDAAMFDPPEDELYRHASCYNIPDDIKHN